MRITVGAVVCLFLLLERLPADEAIFAPGATDRSLCILTGREPIGL
jgi:hypothetical protein